MLLRISAFSFQGGAVFLLCCSVFAQAPVENRQAVPLTAPPPDPLQVVLELQSLRDEISFLLGTVETLEYKVRQLEKKQVEDYADLDRRVAAIYNGEVEIINATTVGSPSSSGVSISGQAIDTISSESSSSAYQRGFAALRQGDRGGAIQAFVSLVELYPQSKEAPDARYWLGETYWLANRKEESRQSFIQLLELTPDYRKAGDAMYRLGVIYDQLGEADIAFDYMSKVLLSGSSQSAAAHAWINERTNNSSETPEGVTPVPES